MPDTKRLKSALAALLADNVANDIGAQDFRDFLESMDVSRGALYWSSFATTTMTLIGTAVAGGTNRVKVIGGTSNKTLNRFTHSDPNKLTYTGTPSIKVDIFAQFCASHNSTPTQVLAFELYLNGAYLIGSYMAKDFPGNAITPPIEQVAVFGETTMATGDFIELYVANTSTAAKVLTPVAGYVNIQEIPLA